MQLLAPTIAVYRLYDLAGEIDLSRISTPRLKLLRSRSGAVRFENPPAQLELGVRELEGRSGLLTARFYDFGIAALSWRVYLGYALEWDEFLKIALSLPEHPALNGFFLAELAALQSYVAPALLRPEAQRTSEEFTVFQIRGLQEAKASELETYLQPLPLLMGEQGPLAADTRREMNRYRFSYSEDDLAILSFDRVLVVDRNDIWDVADLVEFVHAQLLQLSYYDRVLTAELEGVPDVLRQRGMWHYGRLQRLRRRLMAHHAEIADVRARMEGALKITEDLFYAKIYRAATELYGAHEIERSVEQKLGVLSKTYEMVSEEVQHLRSQAVEIAILALILIELVRAFWH